MKKITIHGGVPLFGEVDVSGSKNAALPIIFATLICDGVSHVTNVPDIGDVDAAIDIIRSFGALVERDGSELTVDTRRVFYAVPSSEQMAKIRASSYLIGASLSRFGRAPVPPVGGCNFCYRPIDMHIYAAECLGARRVEDELVCECLHGCDIHFALPSVGATANALLMSAAARGVTKIYGYAREPHINALIDFLTCAGADISVTDECITVVGTHLHGGTVRIIGDMIEAGTYLAAGIITGGEVRLRGIEHIQLEAFSDFLSRLGCEVIYDSDGISARRFRSPDFVSVTADPYPAFPTDLAPIAAPLIARYLRGCIRDNVWRDRFGYLRTLADFGVMFSHHEGYALLWPSRMHSASVDAPDLRGGAACILCALCAEGKSEISSADIIFRGYENIEKKLRALGARIEIANL